MKRIYLDYAASAPVRKSALRVFTQAVAVFGNPSSPHTEGREALSILEDARTRIARLAGTKSDAVLFTSGATESNALALSGHIQALLKEGKKHNEMHVLYLPSAHASVVKTLMSLAQWGVRVEELSVKDGAVDLVKLKTQLRPETVLVSLDLVCGETGAIYASRDVRRVLDVYQKEHSTRIRLHVDGSQAPTILPFELARLGADLLTLDAQKVGGVRGIGVLIAPRSVPLVPLMQGGGQERGLRPGTESAPLATAFAAALEEADTERELFKIKALRARTMFIETLKASIPDVFVNEGKEQAPHILNLSFLEKDTDYLVALMDEAGIAVSTKSACESDSEEGSRAVLTLTKDAVRAASTLRVSWGAATSSRELERASNALIQSYNFISSRG